MRRKQTILRSAASATLALGVMFSLVQCNEATGGTDASSSSSSSVSTSRPDDDDDDDNSGGSSSSSSSSSSSGSESGSPLDEFGTVSGGTLTLKDSLTSENADELNAALKEDPSITSVDFSKVKSIPGDVLKGTSVTKVTVSTTTVVDNAFSGISGLTIAATGSGSVDSSILGGASNVTLDLSAASLTSIEDGAFDDCTSLTSVTLPEGLTTIGDGAFYGCTSLASITLPGSLTSIGAAAFYNCTSLTSVTLPKGLTTIENSAFSYCTSLASIDLPEGLTSIEPFTFFECTSLTQVKLPNHAGAFTIGLSAFYTSAQKELHLCIPNAGMTFSSIDSTAFTNRTVTLYGGENAKEIKNALESAGVKGTGEDGEIEVKNVSAFPGGFVQTGLSLFNLPF